MCENCSVKLGMALQSLRMATSLSHQYSKDRQFLATLTPSLYDSLANVNLELCLTSADDIHREAAISVPARWLWSLLAQTAAPPNSSSEPEKTDVNTIAELIAGLNTIQTKQYHANAAVFAYFTNTLMTANMVCFQHITWTKSVRDKD